MNSISVTLRDAQHLCWKNFRRINDKLDPKRGESWTKYVMTADFLEEADQVATEIKKLEDFKASDQAKLKERLTRELSNLLYMIFVLAQHYDIELEDTFLQTVNDYILKFLE